MNIPHAQCVKQNNSSGIMHHQTFEQTHSRQIRNHLHDFLQTLIA